MASWAASSSFSRASASFLSLSRCKQSIAVTLVFIVFLSNMIVYFTYMGQELVVIHLVLEEIVNLTTGNKVGCISVVISRHDLVYRSEEHTSELQSLRHLV